MVVVVVELVAVVVAARRGGREMLVGGGREPERLILVDNGLCIYKYQLTGAWKQHSYP